jgi:flagellar biosynthetic protein FliP
MTDLTAVGPLAARELAVPMSPPRPVSLQVRLRPVARFAGHYVEMVVAMLVGMAVLGLPVDAIARSLGVANLYHELPETGAIVMTAIMTGPMALWMAVRGHDRRMIAEMSLAMIAPAAGLIAASRLGLVSPSAIPFLTDPLMYASMLAVMLARWRMYAGLGHGHAGASHDGGDAA